ncbi:MAG: YvcK family protein [Magnetococcales bacterium]|nr:YvcK family protein [Magnetococcales bacterium]
MDKMLKVVIFAGGRGASNIIKAFLGYARVDLIVLVNAYDDGLSTGRLRAFIPGMLGPSDVRKNIVNLIPEGDAATRSLKIILEHRFPDKTSRPVALSCLTALVNRERDLPYAPLAQSYQSIKVSQTLWIADYLSLFLAYEQEQWDRGIVFEYGDTSIGNLLFSGCYLACDRDFNRATQAFQEKCEIFGRILNITDGGNQVLVGLKENGSYLADEASIVAVHPDRSKIRDLFLLPDYLTAPELASLQELPADQRWGFLNARHVVPGANPEAIAALSQADLIIYGPGTQHSSLYPSYLVAGVGECIESNDKAEKVFIGNIAPDHDSPSATVQELVERFFHYVSAKSTRIPNKTNLITRLFAQGHDNDQIGGVEERRSYLPLNLKDLHFDSKAVTIGDWEESTGRHSGNQIIAELLTLFRQLHDYKLQQHHFLISIIVPALDEVRTVRRVLQDLIHLDFSGFGVGKEIIFVDGGSRDGTLKEALQERFVRCFQLKGEPKGRGAALRLGIAKAKGNIIVFFPADGEYSVNDIVKVVRPILEDQFQCVIGSRAIKCLNVDQVIKNIYGTNTSMYMVSKYGGLLLSFLSLLLFNRYLSDPLSSLKAFDTRLLRSFDLVSNNMDLDLEIVARVHQSQTYILEVPVDYTPRTLQEGKKSTVAAGLQALYRFFMCRLFSPKRKSL